MIVHAAISDRHYSSTDLSHFRMIELASTKANATDKDHEMIKVGNVQQTSKKERINERKEINWINNDSKR